MVLSLRIAVARQTKTAKIPVLYICHLFSLLYDMISQLYGKIEFEIIELALFASYLFIARSLGSVKCITVRY